MTMHTLKILYLISIPLFVISCRENKDTDHSTSSYTRESANEKQIIKITYDEDPGAVKLFSYKPDGDILKQSLSNGDTVMYNYTDNTITKLFKDNANVWISKIVYKLNEKGKIIQSTTIDDNNKVVSKSAFEYNNEDHLIETFQTVTETGKIFKNELKYSNGNLNEIVIISPEYKILSKYNFEYYDDKPNICNLFLDGIYDDIFPKERLGKKNKNLVRQMVNLSVEGDTLSWLKYLYEDSKNENKLSFKLKDVLNENETKVTYYFNEDKN